MFASFDIGMFFKALGLAFFLEGILWAVSPSRMREAALFLAGCNDRAVRGMGLLAMGAGLLVCSLLG